MSKPREIAAQLGFEALLANADRENATRQAARSRCRSVDADPGPKR